MNSTKRLTNESGVNFCKSDKNLTFPMYFQSKITRVKKDFTRNFGNT